MLSGASIVSPSPPLLWYDYCRQRSSGSSIYLLDRTIEELGFQLKMEEPNSTTFKNFEDWQKYYLGQLKNGHNDMVVISKDESNSTLILGKYPLISLQYLIVSRSEIPPPKNITELYNRKAVLAPYAPESLKKLLRDHNLEFELTSSVRESFRQIKQGKADFTIANNHISHMIAHSENMLENIVISKQPVFDRKLYLAMEKTHANIELLPQLAPFLHAITETNISTASIKHTCKSGFATALANPYNSTPSLNTERNFHLHFYLKSAFTA